MKKIVVGALGVLLLLTVGAPHAWAKGNQGDLGRVVSLPASEVVVGDYFAYGDIVEISGDVDGDVYVAGGQVTVDGHINGDLLVAGGQVNISGTVSQDVRAAGGQVTITGAIGRNVTLAGGDVQLTSAAALGGSVVAAGGSVTISTPVNGNLKVGAGNLTIAAPVMGDVEAGVETMRLSSNAMVDGDLVYYSNTDASIASDASVSGAVTRKEFPGKAEMPDQKQINKAVAGFSLFTKSLSLATTLAVGFLMVKFFPNFVRRGALVLHEHPWGSFGVGFLSIIIVPLAFVLLLVTLVGIPLAFIGLTLYGLIFYFSRVLVMVFMADWILARFNKKMTLMWTLVIGIFFYYLISMIPILGGLIKALFVVAGLGAFFMSYRATWQEASKAKIV